ncbi:hypothetical protein BKA58DRAFT_395954 [Alternaria rosae]|uniref:uncharacterized protein n=1 Tax=Alternaria rosae TaxID=1187941 RepID=UPI001E8DE5E5|nr:uncharacterized protein BKA58DRAFT_395954 [Alternaria rosae]KAH6881549.1 hypothetical protein BKA58DRAFT_395954 [Alternaria rosae]
MQSLDKNTGLSGTGGFACPQTPPPLYASTRDSLEEINDSDSDEEPPTSFPKHLPYRLPPPPLQKRLWHSDTFRIAMASSYLLIILAGTVTGAAFLIIFFQKGSFYPKAVASMRTNERDQDSNDDDNTDNSRDCEYCSWRTRQRNGPCDDDDDDDIEGVAVAYY